MSPIDSLPLLHPPGRSKTRAAWSALLVLLLLFLSFFFHTFLLKMSVRSLLWVAQPLTCLHIKAETIDVAWGKPIHCHHVTITTGKDPFKTTLSFQECSIEFVPWKRLLFGDHVLISSLKATQGTGVIDVRTPPFQTHSLWEKTSSSLASTFSKHLNLLPATLYLQHLSFLLLTEGERYTVEHLSCHLPNKSDGQLTYDSILIEAKNIHCALKSGKADALWDGKKLSLRQLQLADEIKLQDLTIVPHRDRVELGIIAEIFDGLLRGDGSLHHTSQGIFVNSALLGQHLPLGHLSQFLGLQKHLSGTMREGRLTFRGFLLNPMDAEASLRLLADNVCLDKKGWAALTITANLIGRKISLSNFQLKQHENRVVGSGEITLPEEWHKIAQSPFALKLKATIHEASQLAELIGISPKNMTGEMFAEGEVHGATNRAEGYLNLQGTAMTAYEIPMNSLKLQLLFQGEKTHLTNLDIWNGTDRLQCSGIIENKWPHHYTGKASLQNHRLIEKYMPFFQHYATGLASFYKDIPTTFEKWHLQQGTLQASWEGEGEATQHKGAFQIVLHDLLQNGHSVNAHSEGFYGPKWISFSSLGWEENAKKFQTQLTLSSHGIDVQKMSFSEEDITTLSGEAFIPLDARAISKHPFLLSESLLQHAPVNLHLQCHHFKVPFEIPPILPLTISPLSFDGIMDAQGLLDKPSLHIALTGKDLSVEKAAPKVTINLVSEQGMGTLDASFIKEKGHTLTLQGKLPTSLIVQKESAPLEQEEHWKLGSPLAPLDLTCSISAFPLDTALTTYLPPNFHCENSLLTGALSLKGTLGQPEPSGTLQLQIGSLTIASSLPTLHHFQGQWILDKEKMELQNGSVSLEKEKLTLSGSTQWHHQKSEYHLSGTQLPLYQSATVAAFGDIDLALSKENQLGLLHGKILLKEITGTPKLFVIPFLSPPGVEIPETALPASNPPPSLALDIAIATPQESTVTSSNKNPFSTFNLHLMGNLLNPILEGSFTLYHLPMTFPNGVTLSLLEGSGFIDSSKSWKNSFDLTATGTFQNRKITATLLKDHSLQLQSTPFIPPTLLALSLACPIKDSPESMTTWLSQFFYGFREELFLEPTTLLTPSSSPEKDATLGFTGCRTLYHAEIK